jgi:hypothetical protein
MHFSINTGCTGPRWTGLLIIRGADTGHLELSPECAGLYAISKGLARHYADDWELLKHGMVMYDALYIWCECDPGTGST